jgi:thiol:disulfide interchange protein DsbA
MSFLSVSRLLALVITATAVFFAPAGFAQGAPAVKAKFLEINPAQPTEPGKIEVLEFFSYACSHCAAIEPLMEKWIKTLLADVIVKPVPVAFNASMKPMQTLFYTLEAMNRMDLHGKVFIAIHEEKKKLFNL